MPKQLKTTNSHEGSDEVQARGWDIVTHSMAAKVSPCTRFPKPFAFHTSGDHHMGFSGRRPFHTDSNSLSPPANDPLSM